MRRHSEYPTLSKLVSVTNRNLFAGAELDSETDKKAACHYSYNLTRHKTDGNGAERNGSIGSYANGSSGDKQAKYAGNKKDKITGRHWTYGGFGSTPRRRETNEDAVEWPAGGNRGHDILESKVWNSALSRDSKLYSRQYSEPTGESSNSFVKTAAVSMRHNSLPGVKFPSQNEERRPHNEMSPTTDRPFKTQRRKRGICDDTDGSHYQRQFLRVLKKRF